MKRLIIAVGCILLASPALAGHRGIYRGQRHGVAVGVLGAFHHFPSPPIFHPPAKHDGPPIPSRTASFDFGA